LIRTGRLATCPARFRREFRVAKTSSPKQATKIRKASPLVVRLDEESKRFLTQAAELRRISVSDYVRIVTIAQARKEVASAGEQTISLTPEEQLAFWKALSESPRLTEAQQRLGTVMRGES
jgi:uncharacterized protein (DUF1778 family)